MTNTAVIYETSDDMLTAMFGAPQHDRHVQRYRQHKDHIEFMARADAADARVRALLASKREAA